MLVALWFIMVGFILLMGFAAILVTFVYWVRRISAPPQDEAVVAAPQE